MNKLRISVVQYLNTVPLVRGFTHGPLQGKYDLSFTVPSQCAEELRTGAADIAIIPAIEVQRIPNLVILPDLSIASKERVRSLLIVSQSPIREARRIALDQSSRSTQALTKILCDARWFISPEFSEAAPDLASMLATSDAALLPRGNRHARAGRRFHRFTGLRTRASSGNLRRSLARTAAPRKRTLPLSSYQHRLLSRRRKSQRPQRIFHAGRPSRPDIKAQRTRHPKFAHGPYSCSPARLRQTLRIIPVGERYIVPSCFVAAGLQTGSFPHRCASRGLQFSIPCNDSPRFL